MKMMHAAILPDDIGWGEGSAHNFHDHLGRLAFFAPVRSYATSPCAVTPCKPVTSNRIVSTGDISIYRACSFIC